MNDLNIESEIDELIDDLPNAWCEDCEHPRCISKKQSFKQALIELVAKELKVIGYRLDDRSGIPNHVPDIYWKVIDDRIAELSSNKQGGSDG